MTYGQLYDALGAMLRKNPEYRENTVYVAAAKPGSTQGYYDSDCEVVEVKVDSEGPIILSEGDQ